MFAIHVTELGGPEHMKLVQADIPAPLDHQVLIKVKKTSVNFADIKTRYGRKGNGTLPYIPGLDAMGIIEQVGSAVEGLRPGQRVIAFPKNGSYAEYCVADELLVFPLPDAVSDDAAAACPIVSFTAYQLLADVAGLQPGESVLVHAAAGGVGTTAIQLARLLGAGTVIGTVSQAAKASAAYEAGADHVVVLEDSDFAAEVNRLTEGTGVDVVLDSVAGRVSERSMDCLAPYGRLVHFGNSSGEPASFRSGDLHASCRSVLGFSFGTTRARRPESVRATAEAVFGYLADGSLRIRIGERFPLARAADAHRLIESRRSTGKVLLEVSND